MLLSKALGSVLALAGIVASQVVVTVTNTVTVVTVTVQPLTTSTYTTFVTVGANPPPTSQLTTIYITATATTTLTTASAVITTCPIPLYDQCGGTSWSGCTDCAAGAFCHSQNAFYYQCLPTTNNVVTITQTVYKKT
ncbi:hypothetical protein V8E51_015682 [Hyaloscypha variabilis]|uniref:CBM1 domain-containing protein n=1 Tax=Hyaloscypha variabilis (strain UAMH 11265 / GT02V1 / F) TaxID=1149755 RepID=A0A2J6QUG6_HYAVF|nr:hypothetical protein L207DRAFT_592956 [Hyaloscypha variabilis F]